MTSPMPRLPAVPGPVPDVPVDLHVALVRPAVRCVLLDPDQRVLLFHSHVPDSRPDRWWDLPGGGLEDGESWLEAAVREIAEETGLRVPASAVSAPTWRRSSTWTRHGVRRVQHEYVVLVRLDQPGRETDRSGWTVEELAEYTSSRWWPVEEIAASPENFYPGRLPELLPRFLAGEFVDEPFERWN